MIRIWEKVCAVLIVMTLISFSALANDQEDKNKDKEKKPVIPVREKKNEDKQNQDKDRDKDNKKDNKKPGEK